MFDVYGLVFDDSRIFNKKGKELKETRLHFIGQKYAGSIKQF